MERAGEKMGHRRPLKSFWPWKLGGDPKKRQFAGLKYIDVACLGGGTVKRRVCPNCEDSFMAYQGLGGWKCDNCHYSLN